MIYYSDRIQRKLAKRKDAQDRNLPGLQKDVAGYLGTEKAAGHRETLQSQPAGPGEAGLHTAVEATFSRSEEFSSSSFQSPEEEEGRKGLNLSRDRAQHTW